MDGIWRRRLGLLLVCGMAWACTAQQPDGTGTVSGSLTTPSPYICTGKKAAACDDRNPCTKDCYSKSNNGCVHIVLTGGPPPTCSDDNVCSTDDHCYNGKCKGTVACTDNNVCTDDSCVPSTGCVFAFRDAGLNCPDGDNDACTSGDECDGQGRCFGTPISCDDDNPCTADSCNSTTGCAHDNTTDGCTDDNVCTEGDLCGGGSCVPGPSKDCDDGNECTEDNCHPTTGCYTFDVDGQACEDGDICTVNDTCDDGDCLGLPNPCDDSDGCTNDACGASGCTHTAKDCDDSVTCTTDSCSAGTCQNIPDSALCTGSNGICSEPQYFCAPGGPGADPITGCIEFCSQD